MYKIGGIMRLFCFFIFSTFWLFYLSVGKTEEQFSQSEQNLSTTSEDTVITLDHKQPALPHFYLNFHFHIHFSLRLILLPLYAEVPGTLLADTGISGSLL